MDWMEHNQLFMNDAKKSEMKPQQTRTPLIGRVVFYQAFGTPGGEYQSVPRAAIITQVNEDGTVGLAILNPLGLFFNPSVHFSDPPKAGCWSWPPIV